MSDPDIQLDAAALLDLNIPAECLPGVREALAALHTHWRLLEAPADD